MGLIMTPVFESEQQQEHRVTEIIQKILIYNNQM